MELSGILMHAASQAEVAREYWLDCAREFRDITTDIQNYISPAAAEAADLALWTGKLAYADADWTLCTGPGQPVRPAVSLAPGSPMSPAWWQRCMRRAMRSAHGDRQPRASPASRSRPPAAGSDQVAAGKVRHSAALL